MASERHLNRRETVVAIIALFIFCNFLIMISSAQAQFTCPNVCLTSRNNVPLKYNPDCLSCVTPYFGGSGNVPCADMLCNGGTCVFSYCQCVPTTTIPCATVCKDSFGSRVTSTWECVEYLFRPLQCTMDARPMAGYGYTYLCNSNYRADETDPNEIPCCEGMYDNPDCMTCWSNCNKTCSATNKYVSQCTGNGLGGNCSCTVNNNCAKGGYTSAPRTTWGYNPCFYMPGGNNFLDAGWQGCDTPTVPFQCCCVKSPLTTTTTSSSTTVPTSSTTTTTTLGPSSSTTSTTTTLPCDKCTITGVTCPTGLEMAGTVFQIDYKYRPADASYPYPLRKLYIDNATNWTQCASDLLNPTCTETEATFDATCPMGGAQLVGNPPTALVPYTVGCWGSALGDAAGRKGECGTISQNLTCNVNCQYCTVALTLVVNVTAPVAPVQYCSLILWYYNNATSRWYKMFPVADSYTMNNPAYHDMWNINRGISVQTPVQPDSLFAFPLQKVIAPGWYRWNAECSTFYTTTKKTAAEDWVVYVPCV
jgi:hypothetical protein